MRGYGASALLFAVALTLAAAACGGVGSTSNGGGGNGGGGGGGNGGGGNGGAGGGTNPPPSQLAVSTTGLSDGQVQVAYSAVLLASGGSTPYTWSVSGNFPGGLNLDPAAGKITGVPLSTGSFSFTAKVTDHIGAAATATLTITVGTTPPPGQLTLNSVQLVILNHPSAGPWPINATQGNLIVISWIFGPGDYVTSISDNKGNHYTLGPYTDYTSGAGVCGIAYAANATPGVTSISIASLIDSSFDDMDVYDISGASSSPFDTYTLLSSQSSDTPLGPPITVNSSDGIVISNTGVYSNTLTAVDAPFVFDPQDQNNGWAHALVTSTGTYTPTWHISGASFEWSAISATFKHQ